ncbi:hypothetical protein like AT1G76980 [Hibiscus trionum]|uniref:Uncharacterized protein n=1 Tax=Hibiscus trionum TaxID=183268 RepID=A0A9W7M7D8_HIBTR|nr:hypothetical protein like AT1G76980 [Hibiscus trionum]
MFDPAAKLSKFDLSLSKHMGRNYDSRLQKTAQNYRSWNTMRAYETSVMEHDSGVSTPPLWGTNPSKSVDYRCLSPSSKAEAIARGQRELMEMVSRMPESCFELTLKDLVEHRDVTVQSKQESCAEGRGAINEDTYSKEKEKKKKKNEKARIKRSGSLDNGGFLLKMVFPFSFGSKSKMKRNGSNVNCNSRVSPKPAASYESGKSIAIDKEWWKKRSGSSESESDGGRSNVNSRSTKSSCGSVSNTSGRHTGNGCLAFIFNWKRKESPSGLV